MQSSGLASVELAVCVGCITTLNFYSRVLRIAALFNVWAHTRAELRIFLVVVGEGAMPCSPLVAIGVALTGNVQSDLLEVLLHVERPALERAIARSSRYDGVAGSDAVGTLVLLILLPARRWVE